MSAELIVSVAGNALLFLGGVIIASAGIGLLRLPDLYTRTSAVGTAAGLGVAILVLGVVVLDFSWLNLLKAALAIVAQLLTSAIGSFALARAGYLSGSTPAATTSPDELAEDSTTEVSGTPGSLPETDDDARLGEI